MTAPNKYKMPTVQQFLNKKVLCDKSVPCWVYLEKEMRENADIKPYNEKVGEWLKYLRELKNYYHRQDVKKRKELERGVGPPWYTEFSTYQQKMLDEMKECIHQDLIEGRPVRTQYCLSEIGIAGKISNNILMNAMKDAVEDPGLFIWNLYTAVNKQPPCILRHSYDLDSRLMMSCLVFIDKDECIDTLKILTRPPKKEPPKPVPKKKKKRKPEGALCEYLDRALVQPYVSPAEVAAQKARDKQPEPVGYKFKLRSEASYEKICKDTSFLNKRIERNKKTKASERICTYKFWEPPSSLRNTDPKMAAAIEAMKMFKKKARPKFKSPYKNLQYTIGGIGFCKGSPYFIINSVSILPTGFIPINGGLVTVRGKDYVTNIQGYWKFPKDEKQKCDDTCDCLVRWEAAVMDYLKESKCTCGHLYDYHNEGRAKEKYFYPPNQHGPYWIDHAKVFQLDPMEDFIKDTVKEALRSASVTPQPSRPTIEASGLKTKELLEVFLSDISDTPLMIPHLPKANLLHNIQEWVRKRVQGDLTPKQHKNFMSRSNRKWCNLSHINFKEIAYRIPFTNKQLRNMDWSHRKLVQDLFRVLLNDFSNRNRTKLLEQSRFWWSTMKYDAYKSKPFLDIFFTYMPGRLQDSFLINPYSSELTPKFGAKTCPL